MVSGVEAFELGLVNAVVPAGGARRRHARDRRHDRGRAADRAGDDEAGARQRVVVVARAGARGRGARAERQRAHRRPARGARLRTRSAARRSSRAGRCRRMTMTIPAAPTIGTTSSSNSSSDAHASRAMGGEERLDEAPRRRQARRPRARSTICSTPGRSRSSARSSAARKRPADAIVMGSGRIDGRPVMVAAEDFTVKAGTISQSANSKRYRVAELAVADRVPLIMMLEGAGFRADGQRHARARRPTCSPRRAARAASRSSPRCSVRRPDTARSSRRCRTSRVMSRHGAIFTAGPPVVFESLGRDDHQGGPRRTRRSRSRAG